MRHGAGVRRYSRELLACVSVISGCAQPHPGPAPTATAPPAAASAAVNTRVAAVVTVDCIIETSGLPNACRVISNTGSPAYAQRVMAWLTGPHPPRYTPARRRGVTVREHHRWAVKFEAPLDKPATVDVSCLIETSGLPDHC